MFNESEKMKRLPKYIFSVINEIKLEMRKNNEDVIDFSMGNPDGSPPKIVIDKLCESAKKIKNHGYSASKGVYKLRLAVTSWYERRFGVKLDPNSEVCITMGSKEGYVHLIQSITNIGDSVIVPGPTYPIHYYAFIINDINVNTFPLKYNDDFELDEDMFFKHLNEEFKKLFVKPRFVIVNFPHNPTTVVVYKSFYQKLVALAKKLGFFIISDIAYAELYFDNFKTSSIFEIVGAKDVAIETYTLSKSYNMAGWRVGCVCGNEKIIAQLQKIKSWIDYGIFTPIQIASTIALNECDSFSQEMAKKYQNRALAMVKSFKNANWEVKAPKASMFIWAKIPEKCQNIGSLEFSKKLLKEAKIALSPGVGFGNHGENYVRIALIENEKRIQQAARNLKIFLKQF